MDRCATLLSRYTALLISPRCVFFVIDLILSPLQVCLQTFQLLSSEVAPLVWDTENSSPAMQAILQALMDIILGQVSNKILLHQFNLNHFFLKKKDKISPVAALCY